MRIRTLACALALATLPTIARAQHPIEFGVDAGFRLTSSDPDNRTTIQVPVQSLRVGFYVSERAALEPALGLNYTKQGDVSMTAFNPELGLVYDFAADRKASQVYLRPFVGLTSIHVDDGTDSQSVNVFNAGVGLGVKIPMKSVERFAWRLEALYDRGFENSDKGVPAENSFALKVGLSFFTR